MLNAVIEVINTAGAGWWAFSSVMLVQASILIALLFLLDLFLRKRVRAMVRYWIWMLVLAKLALPTSLSLPTGIGYWCGGLVPPHVAQPSSAVENRAVSVSDRLNVTQPSSLVNNSSSQSDSSVIPAEAGIQSSFARRPVSSTQHPVSNQQQPVGPRATSDESRAAVLTWQSLVFLGWLAGMAALAIMVIQRVWFVRALVAQSETANGRLAEAMKECRTATGVRANVELRLTKNMLSPAACGLLRPIVLMPESLLENLSRSKLRAVLTHELVHIKRGDLWLNFIQTILQVAYFYNPLVWVANAMIRQVREQAVDETTLVNLGDEAKDYGTTLVDIAEMALSRPHFSLRLVGVVESKKSLAGRIKHIISRPIPKTAKLGFAGILAVILAGCVLLPMGKAKTPQPSSSVIPAEAGIQSSNFIKKLSSGVTVELVGVCEHPSKDKQWWKPDGSVLGSRPYEKVNVKINDGLGTNAYEFAVKVGDADKESDMIFDIAECGSSGIGNLLPQLRDLVGIVASLPKKLETTDVNIGVSFGSWTTISSRQADQQGTFAQGGLGDENRVAWMPASSTEDGKTVVTATLPQKTRQVRIIAVGNNGRIYSGSTSGAGFTQTITYNAKIPAKLNDIKEFQIQTRPYEWVEFKNVSLKPGVKMNVQVEVESAKKMPVGRLIVAGQGIGKYVLGMSKDDVLKMLGKPKVIFYREEKYTLDNLPGKYFMVFDDISFGIVDDSVEGVSALSPRYKFTNGLGVGDSEQKIKQAFGNNFEFKETEGKDFLTYKDDGIQFEIRKDSRTVMEISVFKTADSINPVFKTDVTTKVERNSTVDMAQKVSLHSLEIPQWVESNVLDEKGGYALRFDGIDDFVRVPNNKSLEPQDAITVEVWAFLEGRQNRNARLLRKAGHMQAGYLLAADQVGDQTIQFRVGEGWSPIRAADRQQNDKYIGSWHHFAGVYDETYAILYIDGVEISRVNHGGRKLSYSPVDLYIGHGAPGPGEYFKGMIDEVRLWNIARTGQQIQDNMRAPLTGKETGLAGYWKFDEGKETTAYDSTDNHNDGKLSCDGLDKFAQSPEGARYDSPGQSPGANDQKNEQALKGRDSTQQPVSDFNSVLPKDIAGEFQKGQLVFQGRYQHRSRGANIDTPSELWIKQNADGGLNALAYLPWRGSYDIASGDKNNRLESYRSGSGSYSFFFEFADDKALLTRRGIRQDKDRAELAIPQGATFNPNSRPDSYCADNIFLRGLALNAGQMKEFRVYDWDNTGEKLVDYTVQISHAGKETITVPAGTFEANHLVLKQITSADTWFKKRVGHITDYWILDNNIIVRIVRHREPYEMELLDYTYPETLGNQQPPSSTEQRKTVWLPITPDDLESATLYLYDFGADKVIQIHSKAALTKAQKGDALFADLVKSGADMMVNTLPERGEYEFVLCNGAILQKQASMTFDQIKEKLTKSDISSTARDMLLEDEKSRKSQMIQVPLWRQERFELDEAAIVLTSKGILVAIKAKAYDAKTKSLQIEYMKLGRVNLSDLKPNSDPNSQSKIQNPTQHPAEANSVPVGQKAGGVSDANLLAKMSANLETIETLIAKTHTITNKPTYSRSKTEADATLYISAKYGLWSEGRTTKVDNRPDDGTTFTGYNVNFQSPKAFFTIPAKFAGLGRNTINGREVAGVEFESKCSDKSMRDYDEGTCRIWIDVATCLPLQLDMEYHSKDQKHQISATVYDFHWNQEIPAKVLEKQERRMGKNLPDSTKRQT